MLFLDFPSPVEDVYKLLEDLYFELEYFSNAYFFLIGNLEKLIGILGCLIESHKMMIMHALYGFSVGPPIR